MSEVRQLELYMKNCIVYNKKLFWIDKIVNFIGKKIERTPSNIGKLLNATVQCINGQMYDFAQLFRALRKSSGSHATRMNRK